MSQQKLDAVAAGLVEQYNAFTHSTDPEFLQKIQTLIDLWTNTLHLDPL